MSFAPAIPRALRAFQLAAVLVASLGCGAEEPAPATSPAKPLAGPEASAPAIVFFGDSLTVGLGLDPALAFPARIEEKLAESGLEREYRVVSAGVSGETTAAGLRRFEWISKQPIEVLVLALGANDGLRGVEVEHTRENLQAIVDLARETHPEIEIVLAGMLAPPNMGPRFTEAFAAIFPALAEENELALIPFLLEGVAGDPALNLADGIHPNETGHEIVAENVWLVLKPLLVDEP